MKYRAQKIELPVARRTPVRFDLPGWNRFPWEEIIYTPVKLMKRAKKLLDLIFWPRRGTDRKTRIIGHIMLRGCATCAGSN